MTYPNEALTDICKQLLDDWMLDPTDIANLAKDIAGECEGIREGRRLASLSASQKENADVEA